MSIYNKMQPLKSKRVLLPSIKAKDLKPLASLLAPSNFVIPILLVSIIGQIADDLKATLNPKEIQQIPSVKLYLKLLSTGKSSVSLSVIHSLSKTLGPELETLAVLNISERIDFLQALKKKIISEKGPSRITSKPHIISDPNELMKHRKGLALQFRSLLIATPIFATHSLLLGLSINQITLECIINSAKFYWALFGLNDEEFDFLLKKEAINSFKKYSLDSLFELPENLNQAIKILLYTELKELTTLKSNLVFLDDIIILHGQNNLTVIESQLKFIERKIPNLPQTIFVTDSNLKDLIIRAAVDQRKAQSLKITNIFKRTIKKPFSGKVNINILKNINIKKTLEKNNRND
uniref:Maturase n=1 Tax=Colacium vesiculosum TaxID=102910 RepID=J3JR59_9EUGL|nr:maturase [Colacium vesiculosum]